MKKFLYFITLLSLPLFAEDLSVVIIGGGPAGLATALEARAQGCKVILIEKRESYTRPRTLFLSDSSLKLLEKWSVDTSPIKIVNFDDGTLVGFISVHLLEQQLEKRALELGVKKICEEFQGFPIAQSYDVIVGADGLHSRVREALCIQNICLAIAKGAFVKILDEEDESEEFEISPVIKVEEGFLRRTKIPKGSLIFAQFPKNASKETLQRACIAQGWNGVITAVSAFDFDVFLTQASAFSNRGKSAIILGDAAATASFFQGLGANTALKTAEIAGRFFQEFQNNPEGAYEHYDQSMKETTTELIKDSAYLFFEMTTI